MCVCLPVRDADRRVVAFVRQLLTDYAAVLTYSVSVGEAQHRSVVFLCENGFAECGEWFAELALRFTAVAMGARRPHSCVVKQRTICVLWCVCNVGFPGAVFAALTVGELPLPMVMATVDLFEPLLSRAFDAYLKQLPDSATAAATQDTVSRQTRERLTVLTAGPLLLLPGTSAPSGDQPDYGEVLKWLVEHVTLESEENWRVLGLSSRTVRATNDIKRKKEILEDQAPLLRSVHAAGLFQTEEQYHAALELLWAWLGTFANAWMWSIDGWIDSWII